MAHGGAFERRALHACHSTGECRAFCPWLYHSPVGTPWGILEGEDAPSNHPHLAPMRHSLPGGACGSGSELTLLRHLVYNPGTPERHVQRCPECSLFC